MHVSVRGVLLHHPAFHRREREVERRQALFGLLVLAQAAHSIEEYLGRLWESFPPARFLTALLSADQERGFVIINVALVGFGAWCFLWPIRRAWRSATALAWFWVVIQMINGVGHPVWSVAQGGYTPGVATAPLLLVLALALGRELLRPAGQAPQATPPVVPANRFDARLPKGVDPLP